MIYDVKKYAEQINKTTSVKLSVYTEDGALIFGEDIIKNFSSSFTGILKVEEQNLVIFKFKCQKSIYVGALNGNCEENYNYACLLLAIFENSNSKNDKLSKEEFLKALLYNQLEENRIQGYLSQYNIKDGKCVAMLFSCKNRAEDFIEVAENYSKQDVCFSLALSSAQFVLVKYVSDSAEEYNSINEFAYYLSQSILEETGIETTVDVGCLVESISKISTSFNLTEETKKMRESLKIYRGVHSFKEFMLLHVLQELPAYKLNEFYKLLTDVSKNNFYDNKELTSTAEEFLENSLNVSETARKLYLHRNTLIYRLDKIESETGLNIRNFPEALTFRLIMLLKNLLG